MGLLDKFNNKVYFLLTISRKKLIAQFMPTFIALIGYQLYTLITTLIGVGDWAHLLTTAVSGAGVGFVFFMFDKGRLAEADLLEEKVNTEMASLGKSSNREDGEVLPSTIIKTDNLLDLTEASEKKVSSFDVFSDDLDEALGCGDTEKSLELLINRHSYTAEEVLE